MLIIIYFRQFSDQFSCKSAKYDFNGNKKLIYSVIYKTFIMDLSESKNIVCYCLHDSPYLNVLTWTCFGDNV